MKKKLFYGFAVLAIAAVAAFSVNLNPKGNGLSDVSLANVEALGSCEGPTDGSVRCCPDPGDVCKVGDTEAPDYDEC